MFYNFMILHALFCSSFIHLLVILSFSIFLAFLVVFDLRFCLINFSISIRFFCGTGSILILVFVNWINFQFFNGIL